MSEKQTSQPTSEPPPELSVEQTLLAIRRKDPRFALDAYRFAFEALDFTTRKYLRLTKPRHVRGQELAEGMRRFALEQFGFMAYDVWKSWGITSTLDLGHIIFNLVNAKLLRATEEDNLDDFRDVYDLRKGLVEGFRFDEALDQDDTTILQNDLPPQDEEE